MRLLILWMGLAITLVLPGPTGAQEDDPGPPLIASKELREFYGDEAFVSIATGSRKPIYKAPAVATVITAEQIKAMGARNLNEVLETVPGLHVSLSPINRLDSIYSIRGIHTGFSPQVLLLMNGIPFPFLFTGSHPTLFRLPVSSISRIEVIRGPGSAVYGADAFAGVINIITKEADDIGVTEVGGRLGSFDTRDLWLVHGKGWGLWDVAFSLEWQESNGDKERRIKSDLQTTFDETFGTNASLAPGPLSTRYEVLDTHLEIKRGDWRLRNWYWRLGDAGQGAGGAQALDKEGRQDEDLYLADLTWRNNSLIPDWDLSTTLYYIYHEGDSRFVLFPPGATLPIGIDGNIASSPPAGTVNFPQGAIGNPKITDNQAGADVVALYSGFLSHRWRLGGGYRYQEEKTEEIKNFGPGVTVGILTEVSDTPHVFMPDSSRKNWYFSLQDEWQFARDWELTAGVRFDHYSDFGNTINPRFALVWSTLHNMTTKLLYGRASRAPSFSELNAINNPVVLGNPDLDPETIDTVELSFDYRPIFSLQTNLSLFAYKAKDLIEFVPDPDGTSNTAQNAHDQEGYGLELEASWDANEKLRITGNYTWQHSEDADTGERIPDAPGQKIYFRCDWKFLPGWTVHPQFTWIADRKRAAADPRSEIDDYTLIDLILRRQGIAQHWDLALAVRNLLDEDAREPSDGKIPDDYPLEGRSLWAEVLYRF